MLLSFDFLAAVFVVRCGFSRGGGWGGDAVLIATIFFIVAIAAFL